jgi:hypothetical protein
MARVERGERLGHAARVLDLQEVRRARQEEPVSVRKPVDQQAIRLGETRMQRNAVLAECDEDGLRDPPRLRLAEAPGEPGWKLRLVERRRVGERLLERPRKDALERLPVGGPSHPRNSSTATSAPTSRKRSPLRVRPSR